MENRLILKRVSCRDICHKPSRLNRLMKRESDGRHYYSSKRMPQMLITSPCAVRDILLGSLNNCWTSPKRRLFGHNCWEDQATCFLSIWLCPISPSQRPWLLKSSLTAASAWGTVIWQTLQLSPIIRGRRHAGKQICPWDFQSYPSRSRANREPWL